MTEMRDNAQARSSGRLRRLMAWLLSDSPITDRDAPSALQQETTREIVTLHARILLHMPIVQLLFVIAVGWIVLPAVPLGIFLVWSVLTVGTEGLRAVSAQWMLPRVQTLAPKHMHSVFMVLDALSGAMVGLAAVLFLRHLPLLHQVLIEVVLFAIAAAGVSVAVSSKYMLAAYSFLVLLGASVTWAVLHPGQAGPVAGLTLLYWGFLIGVSSESERLLKHSVQIRQERDRILQDLERSNAVAHAATDRAEQTAQARARVLAAASHDLRQPLHALSIYSAVLAANPSPQTLREVGHNIDQIVRALGGMLTGLLDLSRLSSGCYTPQQQIFALDQTVAEVCAEYDAAAAEKGLVIRSTLIPIQIAGDAPAVARIARNLIDNAIKYTDHGEIRVATMLADGGAVLSVADTGKGIATAEQEHIFEEFYQTDNPGRDRSQGVGLGLSIVRRLCELMDAHISVESAPGEGACFRVIFAGPMISPGHPAAVPGEETPPSIMQGLRVYVVDDEPDVRNSMRALLRLWGVDVHTAGSNQETETLFTRLGPPDLLIADLRLGESEHGAAMATRLRQEYGPFPVLMITGETASQALCQAREAGFALLQKPIAAEVLHAAIAGMLGPDIARD
ncbi:hybrid sensor histidine kinase/response regulator [Acidithiobacillus sulfuriphilus]|uniref:hybrid sensor histidine kinase/response regulator n=1 Tax=Acidithiobacillus sulfuriphilus TaxID=1867749 RepID=UPI003F62910F